jgi:hypothetical protein
MATDILILGGFTFDEWSTAERMPFGGEQAMVVHHLPGGQRVIDTLGPNDHDIAWHGRLYGSGAMGMALTLDGMRRAGTQLPLIFAGLSYMVVINRFEAEIERLPVDVRYRISCTPVVSMGGGAGIGSALSGSALAAADLAAALAI